MKEPRSRTSVLLCTSPLQVICYRSAINSLMNKDGIHRRLWVIFVHPEMLEQTKIIANTISEQLDCRTLDCTCIIRDLFVENDKSRLSFNNVLNGPARWAKSYLKIYESACKKFEENVMQKVGVIDDLFVRDGGSRIEKFCVDAVGKSKPAVYGIEDGFGDYLPKYWRYKSLNVSDIRREYAELLKKSVKYFMLSLLSGQLRKSRVVSFPPKLYFQEQFCVLPRKGQTEVGKYFIENLNNLAKTTPMKPSMRIIILGTLIDKITGFSFDVEREIGLYIRLIKTICLTHKVTTDEIWYKHHPRLDKNLWEMKKNRLPCSVFDYEDTTVAEIHLHNPSLIAVYSFGSTSMFYAKALYALEAYYIQLNDSSGVNMSTLTKYRTVAKRFSISKVKA